MKSRIKKIVGKIRVIRKIFKTDARWFCKILETVLCKKKIFLIGTPVHGNIGDHLIAKVEIDFFSDRFSDYKLIECTMPFARTFRKFISKFARNSDIIAISGGGWLGSDWIENEKFVRDVIETFAKSKIVILPQTVHYSEIDEFARSGEYYYKRDNILFCVRERKSYELIRSLYKMSEKNILLMPDMALFSPCISDDNNARMGVGVCLRADRERILNEETQAYIMRCIQQYDNNPQTIETNSSCTIKLKDRNLEIENKIREISECKILITDRLHATIMAIIAKTPCIAFDNLTGKVAGVCEWIKDLEYLHIYKPGDDLVYVIDKLMNIQKKECKKDFNDFLGILGDRILHMGEDNEARN